MYTIDLKGYDSSNNFADFKDSINDSKENELLITELTHKINFNNEFITYDENILYNYKNYLSQFIIKTKCPEEFYYKPELVSKKIYGTVDLWYLVMWFNPIPSVMEFNKPVINIFNPNRIDIINRIMNNHLKEMIYNKEEPKLVERNVLKEVVVLNLESL